MPKRYRNPRIRILQTLDTEEYRKEREQDVFESVFLVCILVFAFIAVHFLRY